ncbi:c-type cytochrome [Algoriphagus machipongonensis]|uniref:Cytochrome c-related protein n=1 Tax=Algoriphagus machipongonensis TaxID=388413 RepID=A3HZ12_9BACT|nr:c-type cytochrome [Algoriphagus machipongonensis]EAZ80498.1 cytochrome c-related protein [Algoriphagus machipongonensis]
MKRFLKIVGYLLGLVLILVIGSVAYLQLAFPQVPEASELTLDYSQERIERGEYLANHVTVCMDCHSTRDFSLFSGPPVPGTLGKGGDKFDHGMGFPGVFYSKNITPAGISDYTDGELYRVITTGVTKDNRPMFPVMPYLYYGKMDPEDIYSIIAYIRSLDPIDYEVPESSPDFPVNLILRTIPTPGEPTTIPSTSDQVAYGKYLVNASGCAECHTPVTEQGQIIPELMFSGGRVFGNPDGSILRSSNITQDATGIKDWTEERFVNQFKQYVDSGYVAPKIPAGEFNSIMPWIMYGGMKEDDLKAIYAYLKTIEPISNSVVKFTPAESAE